MSETFHCSLPPKETRDVLANWNLMFFSYINQRVKLAWCIHSPVPVLLDLGLIAVLVEPALPIRRCCKSYTKAESGILLSCICWFMPDKFIVLCKVLVMFG